MRDKLEKYLKKIDEVIERGPYKDNWDSLAFHKVPDWYRNAKLGILFIGECFLFRLLANEWYPRWMYKKDTNETQTSY